MNAPFSPSTILADAHRDAIDEVNRWRGHCLDLFAKIERECVDALHTMAASGRLPAQRRVTLFGARIEALRKGLESGAFGDASRVLTALDKLSNPLSRRNDIVHGVGDVFIDARGKWLWRFRYRRNSAGETEVKGHIDAREAQELEHLLSSGTRRLGDLLKNVLHDVQIPAVTE